MAEHSGQERTEQATPKRLDDARKKGEVLRSKELSILVSLLAAGIGMVMLGGELMEGLQLVVSQGLQISTDEAFIEALVLARMYDTLVQTVLLLAPFLALMTFALAAAPALLGGMVVNIGLLAPKYERIDPFKGLKRIFSSTGLMELLKSLAKFILVATAVIFVFSIVIEDILHLSALPLMASMNNSGRIFLWCFIAFSSVLILVVAMDVPFQIWTFKQKLKMTKQEVRDEMKETDGRPEVKSAIREKQQEFARQRMMSEVPKADVVITNPTHFAVALRYRDMQDRAPIVVAKGKDIVAANIRELAKVNNVTLFSAPPLARALYFTTDLNQEIPANLFLAVAQVLAYVFQIRDLKAGTRKPKRPDNLPVPDEYRKFINKEHD